jgi:hypothetical protein
MGFFVADNKPHAVSDWVSELLQQFASELNLWKRQLFLFISINAKEY